MLASNKRHTSAGGICISTSTASPATGAAPLSAEAIRESSQHCLTSFSYPPRPLSVPLCLTLQRKHLEWRPPFGNLPLSAIGLIVEILKYLRLCEPLVAATFERDRLPFDMPAMRRACPECEAFSRPTISATCGRARLEWRRSVAKIPSWDYKTGCERCPCQQPVEGDGAAYPTETPSGCLIDVNCYLPTCWHAIHRHSRCTIANVLHRVFPLHSSVS